MDHSGTNVTQSHCSNVEFAFRMLFFFFARVYVNVLLCRIKFTFEHSGLKTIRFLELLNVVYIQCSPYANCLCIRSLRVKLLSFSTPELRYIKLLCLN